MCDPGAIRAIEMMKAVRTASLLLDAHGDTMREYLDEEASFDSIMPIVDPTRWMRARQEPHRPAQVEAVRAAVKFLEAVQALESVVSEHADG